MAMYSVLLLNIARFEWLPIRFEESYRARSRSGVLASAMCRAFRRRGRQLLHAHVAKAVTGIPAGGLEKTRAFTERMHGQIDAVSVCRIEAEAVRPLFEVRLD